MANILQLWRGGWTTFAHRVALGANVNFWPPACVCPETPASVIVTSSSGALVPANASGSDIGIDVSTYPELPDGWTLISGRRVAAEMAYRRLTTARGQLSFHPDLGKDLRSYLNAEVTDAQMFAVKNDVEKELERDERVRSVVATCTHNAQTQSLAVRVELDVGDGPFPFTLLVTALDVQLLMGNA